MSRTDLAPRVVISNVYTDDNRGGAALTAAAIQMARAAVPGCVITLISVSPSDELQDAFRYTRLAYPDIEVLPPPFSPRHRRFGAAAAVVHSLTVLAMPRLFGRSMLAVARVREARLVIGKGGQLFRDFPLKGLPSLWLSAFPLLLAARVRVPRVAYGISIGPYTRGHPAASRLAGLILRRLSLVLVRGDHSRQLASDLGVRPDRIIDTPDTVFSLSPPTSEQSAAIAKNLGLPLGRFLAMTITDGMGRQTQASSVFPTLRDVLLALLSEGAVDEVAVIVQTDGSTSSDLAASRSFVQYLNEPRVRLIEDEFSYQDLMALYGAARATIGGRIHSAVFSVVAGTPAFPIEGGGHKAREIFARLEQGDRALRLTEDAPATMLTRIRSVLTNGNDPTTHEVSHKFHAKFEELAQTLGSLPRS